MEAPHTLRRVCPAKFHGKPNIAGAVDKNGIGNLERPRRAVFPTIDVFTDPVAGVLSGKLKSAKIDAGRAQVVFELKRLTQPSADAAEPFGGPTSCPRNADGAGDNLPTALKAPGNGVEIWQRQARLPCYDGLDDRDHANHRLGALNEPLVVPAAQTMR
jgi:hypothetical protein